MPSKQTPKPSLYIRGVVRARNHAYTMVQNGIPPDQIENFRTQIQSVVQSVKNICSQYQTNPEALPVRTYRAYLYLGSLLEQDIPKPKRKPKTKPTLKKAKQTKTFHLRGLTAFCQTIQEQLSLVIDQPGEHDNQAEPFLSEISQIQLLPVYNEILSVISNLNQIAKEEIIQITRLPAPSLRAYQWLSFLSKPENIQAHLLALRTIKNIQRTVPYKKTKSLLRIEFFHIPGLYRSQQQVNVIKMVAHEGFIFSPLPVLESLVKLANNHQMARAKAAIRDYADNPEFMDNAGQLAAIGLSHDSQANGHHQDLQKIFERVNARYFDNQLQPPQLSWSNTLTFRKFGHYQPSTNNLVLSASLDDESIPEFVLDFAMYHELLHKYLGYYIRNGRRISHHATFRKMEAQFPQFDQAQEFLAKFSKKIKN